MFWVTWSGFSECLLGSIHVLPVSTGFPLGYGWMDLYVLLCIVQQTIQAPCWSDTFFFLSFLFLTWSVLVSAQQSCFTALLRHVKGSKVKNIQERTLLLGSTDLWFATGLEV